MIDRDQLREALAVWDRGESSGSLLLIFEAARLVADPDTLIIEPDENGWPPEVRLASNLAMERVGLVGFVDAFLSALLELQQTDALLEGQPK